MHHVVRRGVLACALLGAIPAWAQTPGPPASVDASARRALPADIAAYFEGRWAGSGTFTRSGRPVSSVSEFTTAFDGEALRVEHWEEPAGPKAFAYAGLMSIDSLTGDVVLLMAGNLGGGARLLRGRGWVDDRLVLEATPELHAWFARERLTFERLDADHFRATYEMSRDGGATWASGDVQTFEKVASARGAS